MSFNLSDPVFWIEAVSIFLLVLTPIIIIFNKKISENGKTIIFWALVLPIAFATLYLGGHTIYKNISSETGGPVHWHADYEIWFCGERIDLINPKFPSNKIGSPLFHEHNDDRVHVEGTVSEVQNVDFGSYFKIIGGELREDSIKYPTENGILTFKNGDLCNGEPSTLKVFVNGNRIENPVNYLPYPSSYVPPGDCVIIEFDSSSNQKTDRICSSWAVQDWSYDNMDRKEITIGDHTWQ